MDEWGVRGRLLLSDNLTLLVGVLVVLAALGGGVSYATYVEPGTVTESEPVGQWATTAGYTHSATVIEDTEAFPAGTVLENRETYFTEVAPVLDGRFSYRFDAPGGEVDATVETVLVFRSADEEREYWRVEEPLNSTSATLGPGERVTTAFQVNTTRATARLDRISSEVGASPGETSVFVVSRVTADGQTLGESVDAGGRYQLGFDLGTGTYSVTGPRGESNRRTVTALETRTREYGPLRTVGGPLLLLLGLGGLASLAFGWQQGLLAVSAADRRALAFARERDEFDEFISRGTPSRAALERPAVRVDSLADLVDVAIDTDSAVLETPGGDAYYVVHDGYLYRYDAPAEPEADEPRLLGDASTSSDEDAVATANGGDESADQSGE